MKQSSSYSINYNILVCRTKDLFWSKNYFTYAIFIYIIKNKFI